MGRKAGFKLPEETKKKIAETQRKNWSDPNHREYMVNRIKSGINSVSAEEHKRKISEKAKERWADPEFRERIKQRQSEGARKRWADPEKRQALLDARNNRKKEE